jgi:IclR family KDG regulon transcriptional repressor
MSDLSEANNYGIRAVERAGTVLRALAAADGPRALPAVAAAADLSRPTTFRLLRTLESLGFVQSNDGRYTLGIGILELAQSLTRQLDVASVTRPLLVALRNELDETCGLTIRSGDFCVPIVVLEALQSVRRVVPVGAHLPLYASSTGKVILAHDNELDVDEYLARTNLIAFSPTTTTEPEQLREQLREVREQGCCWGVNGRGDGGASVSFPIFRHDNRLAAALFIVCPASRFNDGLRDRCLEVGRLASRHMSEALGYRFSPGRSHAVSNHPVVDRASVGYDGLTGASGRGTSKT